jgi:bifunctional non-homologous end joining protein LigD
MDKYISTQSPISEAGNTFENVTWLKPELVGEFRFAEWTKDKKLRHPSFKGLRYDKKPQEVVRELPDE